MLDLYYYDRPRLTYIFQTYAFLLQDEINSQVAQETEAQILIGDRSIFSTFYVFGKMLFANNALTPLEWYIFRRFFNYAQERYTIRPRACIYLRTTPDTCYLRIKKRSRCEESSAQLDFFVDEYNYHEKWLIEKDALEHECLKDCPVLILDGNLDFINDLEVRETMIKQIREFIAKITKITS